MDRGQDVPQSPSTNTWKGLWVHHLSSFIAVGAMFLAAGGFLFGSLQFDPRESLIQMKGRLASLNLVRGNTDEENVFQFTVQEYPDVFKVKNLKIADQLLLANLERPGNLFQFAVSREEYEERNGGPVRVYELSSDENTYLNADNTGSLKAKARLLGFVLVAISLFGVFKTSTFLLLRSRKFADPAFDRGEVDALLLWLVEWMSQNWPARFRPAWIQEVHDLEAKRRAAVPERPKTDAPKAVKAVRMLLKQPHRINAHGENGKTPLHLSVDGGHMEAVELLLKNGADPELPDEEGNTALVLALKGKSMGVVMRLLEFKAKVQVANKAGETPIDLATKHKIKGMLPLVQKALEKEKATATQAKAAEALPAGVTVHAPGVPTEEPQNPPAPAAKSVPDPGNDLVKAVVPAGDSGDPDDDSGDGFGKAL